MSAFAPSLLLLIPAYNEENRIGPVLEDYADYFGRHYAGKFRLVVVLNGCRDNTLGVVEFAEKRKRANMHMEEKPQAILDQIQMIVLQQQNEFNRIWNGILKELKKAGLIKNSVTDLAIFVKENFPEFANTSIGYITDSIHNGKEPSRGSTKTVEILKDLDLL